MYGYIKGFVVEANGDTIIVDNNGIGYMIIVPNPYAFELNKEYLVYTYTYVREDEFSLYGFITKEEKEMFLKLISVKGIGPKAAITMLGSSTVNGIKDAIERENILYLKKIPRIGDKAARQIILDLKGKLTSSNDINPKYNEEVYEALVAFGYKSKDITKVLSNVDSEKSVEEQIKEALRLLLK